jgi:hypothetical protein
VKLFRVPRLIIAKETGGNSNLQLVRTPKKHLRKWSAPGLVKRWHTEESRDVPYPNPTETSGLRRMGFETWTLKGTKDIGGARVRRNDSGTV